ncbi:hypothetical protein Goshw_027233, partial [Gossypium schwendimanii]|nr:hypothetical protein [Gossypium schwendimanii]
MLILHRNRLKLWLFLAYVVSFVSLAASVGLLMQDIVVTSGPSLWTGTAGWTYILDFSLGITDSVAWNHKRVFNSMC